MSDVLSAYEVEELLRELRLVDTDDMESARRLDIEAALARSHEQLRARVEIELELRKASYDRIAQLESERNAAVDAFDAMQDRALKAEDERDVAYGTVNKVWQALDNPPYDSLDGKTVWEVVASLRAATRAGGCAADLAEALREIGTSYGVECSYAHGCDCRGNTVLREKARDAHASYDRAASGQTAEKEEA